MKINKLTSLTVALMLGIGGAAIAANDEKSKEEATKPSTEVKATTSEVKAKQTTYHAIRIGSTNQFTWTDDPADLAGLECLPLQGASCSVDADVKPENNENPDPSPDNMAYQQP